MAPPRAFITSWMVSDPTPATTLNEQVVPDPQVEYAGSAWTGLLSATVARPRPPPASTIAATARGNLVLILKVIPFVKD